MKQISHHSSFKQTSVLTFRFTKFFSRNWHSSTVFQSYLILLWGGGLHCWGCFSWCAWQCTGCYILSWFLPLLFGCCLRQVTDSCRVLYTLGAACFIWTWILFFLPKDLKISWRLIAEDLKVQIPRQSNKLWGKETQLEENKLSPNV